MPWRRLGLGQLAASLVELVVLDFRYFLPGLAGAPVLALGPEVRVPDTNAEAVPEGVRVSAEGVIEAHDAGVPVFSGTPITDPGAVYASEVSFTVASSRSAIRKTWVYPEDGSVYGSSTVSEVTLTAVPSTAIGWTSESRWFANAHPGLLHRLELLFAFWR